MKTSRRQFIKLTGLATGGVISGLPSLAQFFEFIPPGEQTFLPINGIFANPASILDNGVHLRWSLPPSKGIPDIINIFRRKSQGNAGSIRINPANSNLVQLPLQYRDLTFEGSTSSFSLTETTLGKFYNVRLKDPSKKIRILFSENVTSCTIQLGQITKSKIRVFYPDNTLSHEFFAENSSNSSAVTIVAQNGRPFKSIEIQLNFSYLYFIEFTGSKYLCDSEGWVLIGKIDNVNDIREGKLLGRISATTKNHYIKSVRDIERYRPIAKNYRGLMTALQSPDERYFEKNINYSSIDAIPFEKLTFKAKNGSSSSLNAYNLLMLGCIDPNIARLAGLYFVDNNAKSPDEVFDYKVEAVYKNIYSDKSICGVILNIGGRYSEQPKLNEQFNFTQINNTRWEFDKEYNAKHFGKVRLAWRAIDQNPNNESWKRYINPVVYSLQIDSNPAKLIAPRTDELNFYFIDQNAKVGETEVEYKLMGIDIFGQESNILREKIRLKDNDIPACPVRLNFNQLNDKILLNFEYGGFQYLTDPEINNLDIYFKNDSIYTQNVKARYNSFLEEGRDGDGNRLVAIYLEQAINLETRFYALHFIETISGVKLPAAKRKKFKVIHQNLNNVEILLENEDNFIPDSNGIVLLEADPRSINNTWTKSNDSLIKFKKPIQARLLNYNHFVSESEDLTHFTSSQNIRTENSFKAIITDVKYKIYSDNVDLFNPESILEVDDEFTEITIDRTLNESDIFTGGKLKFHQSIYTVASQNAGYGNSEIDQPKTKLTIKGHIPVSRGEALLIPPEIRASNNGYINNYMVLWLSSKEDLKKIKNNGEFMFRGTKANLITETNANNREITQSIEEPIHIIATLMSDIYKHQNQWQVLVRIGTKSSFLHTEVSVENSDKVLFFEPYSFDVSEKINKIQLQAKDAFKNVYFTANATDNAKNKSSFSVIAQFIKTRNKNDKPLAPTPPYPCANPNAFISYLKLPNSEGISYFKVCWNGSSEYRYEVGRALDKSIIASHRDLWLKGLSYSSDNEQALALISLLSIGILNATNGTVEVSFTKDNISDPTIYLGGRLFQGVGRTKKSFEIVKVSSEPINRFKLLLRPMQKGEVPSNIFSCTIQKLPDYKAILEDDIILKQLANLAPTDNMPHIPDGLGAFNVVTGQPLRDELSFLDEVPGLGSSRFFYKVRAVDGSENRSLWSGASVAVRQVDTRVPDAPIITFIEGQEQAAYIKWKNENDPKIIGYNLYRTDKKVNPNTPDDYQGEQLIRSFVRQNPNSGEFLASPAKLRVRHNQVEIPSSVNSGMTLSRIKGIYKIAPDGNPELLTNYFIRQVTILNGEVISLFQPQLIDGTLVVVVLNSIFNEEVVIYKNEQALLITNNETISIPIIENLNIQNPILGIFKQEEYSFGKSIAEQTYKNYIVKDISEYNSKNRTLKYLYGGLAESEALALKHLNEGNVESFVTVDSFEYEYTDDLKDNLTLDLFYNYRLEAFKSILGFPSVVLSSKKSKNKLLKISMVTAPILKIEYAGWFTLNNQPANTNSQNPYVHIKITTNSITNIAEISRMNLNEGTYKKIINSTLVNDIEITSLVRVNNLFIKEIIDRSVNQYLYYSYKIVISDQWGNYSEKVININSLK